MVQPRVMTASAIPLTITTKSDFALSRLTVNPISAVPNMIPSISALRELDIHGTYLQDFLSGCSAPPGVSRQSAGIQRGLKQCHQYGILTGGRAKFRFFVVVRLHIGREEGPCSEYVKASNIRRPREYTAKTGAARVGHTIPSSVNGK